MCSIVPEYCKFPGHLSPSMDIKFEDVPYGLAVAKCIGLQGCATQAGAGACEVCLLGCIVPKYCKFPGYLSPSMGISSRACRAAGQRPVRRLCRLLRPRASFQARPRSWACRGAPLRRASRATCNICLHELHCPGVLQLACMALLLRWECCASQGGGRAFSGTAQPPGFGNEEPPALELAAQGGGAAGRRGRMAICRTAAWRSSPVGAVGQHAQPRMHTRLLSSCRAAAWRSSPLSGGRARAAKRPHGDLRLCQAVGQRFITSCELRTGRGCRSGAQARLR